MYNPYQNRIVSQMNMLKNPQAMVKQMPQYNQIVEYIKANGGDAKTAFYAKAKEMGVNPEEILKAMRNA